MEANEIEVTLISVKELNSPINPAPTAKPSSKDKNTKPKAILILILFSKVVNSV